MCEDLDKLACNELKFGTHPNLTTANSNFTLIFNIDNSFINHSYIKFTAQDRKIAVIIDKCPAYLSFIDLQSVELVFLPPNTTSTTKPLVKVSFESILPLFTHQVFHCKYWSGKIT